MQTGTTAPGLRGAIAFWVGEDIKGLGILGHLFIWRLLYHETISCAICVYFEFLEEERCKLYKTSILFQ